MATPPVQITGSPWLSGWTTGYPKLAPTSGSFAVTAGAIVVVAGVVESANALGTPTNAATGPATITWTQRGNVLVGSRCWASIWTGAVTVSGNVQVSCAVPPSGASTNSGIIVWAFDNGNHGGLGQVPAGVNGTTTPSITATWAANSMVMGADGDFAAAVTTGHAYRTNLPSPVDDAATNVDGAYTAYAWHHADSGSGGSVAIGMTAPTQTFSAVATEVLGTTSTVDNTSKPALPGMFTPQLNQQGWF